MNEIEKKQFILSRIAVRKKEIENIISKLNRIDAITTLLSIYEAHSYALQDIAKNLPNYSFEESIPVRGVYVDTINHHFSILKLLEYILVNLENRRSELDRIPIIDTIVFPFSDPNDPRLMKFLESKYNLEKDYIKAIDLSLLGGQYQTIRCYPIRDFYSIRGNEQIELSFELLRAFHSKLLYESTLHYTDQIDIDEGKISFPNITKDDFLKQDGIHPRTFGGSPEFPHWNPSLLDHRRITEKTYHLGLRDPEHQKTVRQLLNKQFDEYRKVPDFKQTFEKNFSVELEKYIKISTELFMLTYDTDEAQILILKSKLISKLKKLTGCSKQEVKSIIEEKTWKKGYSLIEKPLIFDGVHYQFTHGILQNPLEKKLRKCYNEIINNDTKGKHFENDCRQIFRDNSCYVLDSSVKINAPFLPESKSIELWDFIKDKTDIDVIGLKSDILFVIECKTRKRSLKIKKKIKDYLKNSFDETYYKGKWISENFDKFCLIVKKQGLEIPKKPRFVVPLFVSNIPTTIIENYNPISLSELREIIRKIKSPVPVPNFKIIFDSKAEERFSSFFVK